MIDDTRPSPYFVAVALERRDWRARDPKIPASPAAANAAPTMPPATIGAESAPVAASEGASYPRSDDEPDASSAAESSAGEAPP